MSLEITVGHHSASLVMPNGDPWERLFYPTLTRIMGSYIPPQHLLLKYFSSFFQFDCMAKGVHQLEQVESFRKFFFFV